MPRRRIGGAGGGSDPAPKAGGGVLVAMGLVVAMATSGGGMGAGGASFGGGPAANPTAGQTVKARKAESKKTARQGSGDEAWRRMGLRRTGKTGQQRLACVAHSFGDIRRFFSRSPCRSMRRMVFGVGDGGGSVAAVTVVWVTMPSRSQERRFRKLIDVHGNGDIAPLGAPLLRSRGVRFTGLNYGSEPHGKTTAVAEAERVSGHFDRTALDAIAEVAAAAPPP